MGISFVILHSSFGFLSTLEFRPSSFPPLRDSVVSPFPHLVFVPFRDFRGSLLHRPLCGVFVALLKPAVGRFAIHFSVAKAFVRFTSGMLTGPCSRCESKTAMIISTVERTS